MKENYKLSHFSSTLVETPGRQVITEQGHPYSRSQTLPGAFLSLWVDGSQASDCTFKGIYLSQKEVKSHTEVGNKRLFRGLKQPNIIWIRTCNAPTLHNDRNFNWPVNLTDSLTPVPSPHPPGIPVHTGCGNEQDTSIILFFLLDSRLYSEDNK